MAQSLPFPPSPFYLPCWFISISVFDMLPSSSPNTKSKGHFDRCRKNPLYTKAPRDPSRYSCKHRQLPCLNARVFVLEAQHKRREGRTIELFFSPIISTPAGHWQTVRDKTREHADARTSNARFTGLTRVFLTSRSWPAAYILIRYSIVSLLYYHVNNSWFLFRTF